MRELLSPQSEDYLKAIYRLSHEGPVNTLALAEALSVSSPSVTGMLKKLHELGLVEHIPYKGVTLTESGEKVALELIRHHRLLELYLHQALGYPLEAVHAEAERLEHHISEEFEARIFEKLGQPTHDPHGDPIPALDGSLPDHATVPLTSLEVGHSARVGRVAERDAELLRQLVALGLVPGATVRLVGLKPKLGTVQLEVNGSVHTLGLAAAEQIWLENLEPEVEA